MAAACEASTSGRLHQGTPERAVEEPTPRWLQATPDGQPRTEESAAWHPADCGQPPESGPIESGPSTDPPDRSESTDVAIRGPRSLELARDVIQLRTERDATNPSACRHCPERDFGDPLEVTSEAPTAEAAPAANRDATDKGSPSDGLSQLLSKILEQLSVSAWLPAAMLVGNTALLLQLHSDHNIDIAAAVKNLTEKPLGTIIVLAFSLLLTTIVTQAFEFGIIRLLEGYFDSTHKLIQAGVALRINRHQGKLKELEDKRKEMRELAFEQARRKMLSLHDPFYRTALSYIEEDIYQVENKRTPAPEVAKMIKGVPWKRYVPPDTSYRLDSIEAQLDSYPKPNRVLPTRLGNVLRASEDKIKLPDDEDLEGFVIRHFDQVSPTIKSEHKDYRTRLQMYCCLVLVFASLVPLGLALLIGVGPAWAVALFVAAYVAMTYVCYKAAIASAQGYGHVLQEMNRQISKAE